MPAARLPAELFLQIGHRLVPGASHGRALILMNQQDPIPLPVKHRGSPRKSDVSPECPKGEDLEEIRVAEVVHDRALRRKEPELLSCQA